MHNHEVLGENLLKYVFLKKFKSHPRRADLFASKSRTTQVAGGMQSQGAGNAGPGQASAVPGCARYVQSVGDAAWKRTGRGLARG